MQGDKQKLYQFMRLGEPLARGDIVLIYQDNSVFRVGE
jgi:hypothetical protein